MLEQVYPNLRAVDFRYSLRRRGMIQDTVHTTVVDTTYRRGVELLQKRKYREALAILGKYRDRNTAIALLSLGGRDEETCRILRALPPDDVREYLSAIACARLGRIREGREHLLNACNLNPRYEYRGKLDPEITELLKTE